MSLDNISDLKEERLKQELRRDLDKIIQANPERTMPVPAEDLNEQTRLLEQDLKGALNDMYKLPDIAGMTGQHSETLRRAVRNGQLKADKQGKSYLVTKPDLIKYLELIGLNTELNLKGSKFYSTIGVAFKLNIKLDTVKKLIEDDKLKSKQIENQYWIREEHLKAYLEDDLQI